MFACKSLRNFIDKANKSKIYCFYTCIDCDLKVSKHIMGPFSDIEKNHKDYSQKLCSVEPRPQGRPGLETWSKILQYHTLDFDGRIFECTQVCLINFANS